MKLYAKLLKWEFWSKKVSFLGYVISDESIVMDPSEVDVVLHWEAPKLVKEIRSFLDLVDYHRKLWKAFTS